MQYLIKTTINSQFYYTKNKFYKKYIDTTLKKSYYINKYDFYKLKMHC